MNRKCMLLAGAFALFAPFTSRRWLKTQTLTVITAGDQNMVDYINDYLGAALRGAESGRDGARRRHRPGRRRLAEDLRALAAKASESGDVDVAVVHQKMAGQMVEEDLLASYRADIPTGDFVTRDTAENALGTNVRGYVMPMFNSQTAIAYNPALVPNPPKTYEELVAMGEGETRAVRLQRHQGRHVGRQLRDGLDVCLHRRCRAADERPLRRKRHRRLGRALPTSRSSTRTSSSRPAMPARSTC